MTCGSTQIEIKKKERNTDKLNYVSDSLQHYHLSAQEVVLSPHGVLGIPDIALVPVDKTKRF